MRQLTKKVRGLAFLSILLVPTGCESMGDWFDDIGDEAEDAAEEVEDAVDDAIDD